jgi:hypothetical protein
MNEIEILESAEARFAAVLSKIDLDDQEKIDLLTEFSAKPLSEQLLMIKVFESRVKSQEEQIQQRFVEEQKRRVA